MTIAIQDQTQLQLLSKLAYCNPFTTDRIELERRILGDQFVTDDGIAWSRHLGIAANDRPNVRRIAALATELIDRILNDAAGKRLRSRQLSQWYWDVTSYVLLYRHVIPRSAEEQFNPPSAASMWKAFANDYERYAAIARPESLDRQPAGHLFACLCQVHRAFVNTFEFILGNSEPSVRLRGAIWQSIFTNDLLRYRRSLYNRMNLLPVLITGPTGTGKELVARAIGLSQYIPFDEQRSCFVEKGQSSFFPLNLSALSATLIESELFGHCKGAFTGAVSQRIGWLEQCRPHGAIFLDEIGELDPSLQVKLLRVVQQRSYSRLGETTERQFTGKIIGATNRLMDEEIQAGRFREDLYFRLCADRIQTPGLREQLDHSPEDLHALCLYISSRLTGDDGNSLAEQAVEWIASNLGHDYPWRGNIRELEQCVGSIMIRGEYLPSGHGAGDAGSSRHLPDWVNDILRGQLTADEVLQCYCTWMYARTGSYEATGRQLGLDRRTVKSKIDQRQESQASE